jgi:hypothetical protein
MKSNGLIVPVCVVVSLIVGYSFVLKKLVEKKKK